MATPPTPHSEVRVLSACVKARTFQRQLLSAGDRSIRSSHRTPLLIGWLASCLRAALSSIRRRLFRLRGFFNHNTTPETTTQSTAKP